MLSGKDIIEDMKKFFKKTPTPELGRTIKQVIEQIEANTAWLSRDKEDILTFLKTQ
jgi:hypothetical protein